MTKSPNTNADSTTHAIKHSSQTLDEFVRRAVQRLEAWKAKKYPSELFRGYQSEDISTFIRIAFDASLHTEEGRPTRARLALGGVDKLIKFSDPIEFTPLRIAKLAPIIGLSRRQLVVELVEKSLKITAIRDPFRGIRRYASVIPEGNEPDDHLLLSIYGPAKLSLSGLASGVLRINAEHLAKPLYETEAISDWLRAGSGEKLGVFWRNRALESMVRRIREEGRGGCVVVVPEDCNFEEFIEGGIGVEQDFFSRAIEERIECQDWFPQGESSEVPYPMNLDQAHFIENDFERTIELVAALGSIDGAIVMSRDWRVLRFGAKIKVTNHVDFPSGIQTRGTRHRSAYSLCKAFPEAIAIVISQDGDVSVISNTHEMETATLDEAWIDRKY